MNSIFNQFTYPQDNGLMWVFVIVLTVIPLIVAINIKE
jgi:hypothetical protein